MWQSLFSRQAMLQLVASWSIQQLAVLLLIYNLQMTVLCLYPAFLVVQIRGCGQIDTIGHIAIVYYLIRNRQPSPLTLRPLAASVSLLLLVVCAHITELCSLITRQWLLLRLQDYAHHFRINIKTVLFWFHLLPLKQCKQS